MTAGVRSLLHGAATMVMAEMVNRIARLATIIVLARMLTLEEFAVVALALTVWELVRMLSHNGLGARIVTAQESELGGVCRTVNRLNWLIGTSMCALQCALAWPVANAFGKPELALMLIALSVTYLINPLSMVRAFLAQRIPGLRFTAASTTALAASDNLLTAALVLSGFGPWGAILPKIILAPAWLIAHMLWAPAPPTARVSVASTDVMRFSLQVFVAEAMATARQHADRLVIGRVLGIEALGVYAFAANSGAGITQSLSAAASNAILPFLSRSTPSEGGADRFWVSVKVMAAGIVPIVALQSLLAPWYVPLVFGAHWAPAAPILAVLCLASLSRIVTAPMTQFLRAKRLAHVELQQSVVATLAFMAGLAVGLPFGLTGAAIGIVAANLIVAPLFLVWGLAKAGEVKIAQPQIEGQSA